MKKFIIIAFCLSACANPAPKTTESVKEDFSDSTKSVRAKVADFFYPEVDHSKLVQPVPTVTTEPFCYTTWDKPVCYDRPEPANEQTRLVGYQHVN